MKKQIRDILETPFTPEMIKQREGIHGQMLDYIEGWAVIECLNQAFEADWTFEIEKHEILENEVLVLGKLSAGGVTKTQFGSSTITRDEQTGTSVSLGDDLKAAATDAVKKCASLLGVGLHLYNGNGRTSRRESGERVESGETVKTAPEQPASPTTQAAGTAGEGNGPADKGNGGARLTNKQLNYLNRICRERRMSKKELAGLTKKQFGVQPEYLSRKQASELIDQLLKQ
jgi:hypothetical protein